MIPYTRIRLAALRMWSDKSPLFSMILLLIVAGGVFAIGLDLLPVMDRDEARFAQASRQMAQSGDWIDIRFQDAVRYKKPIGIYWAQAGFARLFGTPEIWVYRLPSYLGAIASCLALVWAGAPLIGVRSAQMAGFMLACLLLLHVEARLATTDAALLAVSLLSMGALSHAWMNQHIGRAVAAVFWTALAAGILLKGPLGLAPAAGAILWIALFTRHVGWLRQLRPLYGVIWVLCLCLPWFIAISIKSQGQFIELALWGDMIGKIETSQENHGAPPGTYTLAFWITFWPWTLLAPAAALYAWRNRVQPAVLFLTGWVVPFWIVLELVPTKLPHYPLLLYPAIVLIAAAALQHAGRYAVWGGAILWASGLCVIAAATIGAPIWLNGTVLLGTIIGVIICLCLSISGVILFRRGQRICAMAAIGGGAVTIYATLFALTLPALSPIWISPRLSAATAHHSCLSGPIMLSGYHEPSAVFLLGTDTQLTDRETALATLSQTKGAAAWITDAGTDGVEGITRVSGRNYNSGDAVSLRLYIWPGIPAPIQVCPRGAQ